MAQIVSSEESIAPFFEAYPNPVGEELTINYRGFFEIQIANILGQKIQDQNAFENATIDVTNFENGIYILSILKNGEITHSEKIQVQH